MKQLSFSIDKYELEEINNSQFARLKIYVCHDLYNKNKSYISFESMKEAEQTIINKPIIMKLNRQGSDFEEHENDTVAIGFIPETGNNLHYEVINDMNYLVVDAIIWKYYSSNTLAIFQRDDIKKVSMEIQVLSEHKRDDGMIQIDKYAYLAICLLGDKYETGMHNTVARIIDFSKDNDIKTLYEQWVVFVEEKNKDKEVKLMSDIKNVELKDVVVEAKIEDLQIDEMAKDGEEMVKCTEEMAKCGEEMAKNTEEMAKDGEEIVVEEPIKEEPFVEIKIEIEPLEETDPLSIEDEGCKGKYSKPEENNKDFSLEIEKRDNQILDMNSKLDELMAVNAKLTNEIEELKLFKQNIVVKEKDEQINKVFSNLSNVLNKNDIEQWKEKSKDYENVDVFERDIKSFACDKILQSKSNKIDEKTTFSSMAINIDTNDDNTVEHESVWDRISKRVSK